MMSAFLESFLTPQTKVRNLAANVQFLRVIIDPSTPKPQVEFSEWTSIILSIFSTNDIDRMEFERSIFRMHERLLLSRTCGKCTKIYQRFACCMFFYFFLGFVFYHKLYVNNSDILVGAMEEQLLSHNSIAEYKHLTYSETTDRFIFCNKVSFNRNDTVHLAEQAVKKTNLTK